MMTLILSACAFGQKVPKGYINAEEHFDTEGFQDYTDYCKYYYQDKSAVEKDARYSRVSKADIAAISNYFAHFRSSAATDVANAYDFNPNSISEGDYVLIETKEGKPIGDTYYLGIGEKNITVPAGTYDFYLNDITGRWSISRVE